MVIYNSFNLLCYFSNSGLSVKKITNKIMSKKRKAFPEIVNAQVSEAITVLIVALV